MATLAQNIQRAIDDFNSIENAIVQKGVPVPDGTPTSEYGEKILSIETGVDTSGDTVVPSALREGYTAHNAAGQEITGTIPDYSGGNTVEMTSPEGVTLNTAGTYCEGNIEVVPKLQEKTATTGEIVTADEGYTGLKSVDTTPAFEAGKKSEYDAFWDAYQENGTRKNYLSAFAGAGWSSLNVFPKYNMHVENAIEMFYHHAENLGGQYDLVEHLEKQGIDLDFSRCGNYYSAFAYAYIRRIGVVNFSGIKDGSYALGNAFIGSYIVTIDKVIVSEETAFPNSTFQNCKKLSDLTIEGTIGQNGFDVSWSPLSKASLVSIVNALSDTTTGLTITLRASAVKKAFETSEGANDGDASDEWLQLIATKPNWTINTIDS